MTDENKEETKQEDKKQDFIEAVKRNEEILAEMKVLTERNEQLAARNLLGGKSEAGQQVEKKEETPLEYRKRMVGY